MFTNKKFNPTIAMFLKTWRECEELSQKEFAKILKISPANLCDLEKGRKKISPEKAHKIGLILGYPSATLVKLALQEQLNAVGLKNYKVKIKKAA